MISMARTINLILLVRDLAHFSQACPGASERILKLEDFDL